MDVLNAIFTRRSVRRFTLEPVTDAQLETILRAGMAAPSAGNQQPWQFVVIKAQHLLDEIPRFHPYASMLPQVSAAILVCGDLSLEKHKGFWVQDCSAATQNMLLAAHGLGLGSVWIGVYPREERMAGFITHQALPEHIVPFALLPLGTPATPLGSADRYDVRRVHTDKW